jgi:MraZ protein
MNFIGDISCSVDDKGRVKMPVAYSRQFPDADKRRFMIAKDIEDCLVIYPLEVWKQKEGELRRLSQFNTKHRAFVNAITAGLTEVEMDSADRFLISRQLIKYIGNAKEVVLKGLFDRIQIWETTKYEQYVQGSMSNIQSLADEVSDYLYPAHAPNQD